MMPTAALSPGSGALASRRMSVSGAGARGGHVHEARNRVYGLLWALLDREGDREAGDLPEQHRGHVRALYAAAEVYTAAEVAVVQAARWRRWTWALRVLPAALAVAWTAGRLAERVSAEVSRSSAQPTTTP